MSFSKRSTPLAIVSALSAAALVSASELLQSLQLVRPSSRVPATVEKGRHEVTTEEETAQPHGDALPGTERDDPALPSDVVHVLKLPPLPFLLLLEQSSSQICLMVSRWSLPHLACA